MKEVVFNGRYLQYFTRRKVSHSIEKKQAVMPTYVFLFFSIVKHSLNQGEEDMQGLNNVCPHQCNLFSVLLTSY